jgi:5-hydroxyisourate hydrolase-like protein (transthyretin family)
MTIKIFIIGIICLSLLSCNIFDISGPSKNEEEEMTILIQGTVTDAVTNKPIANVKIRLERISAPTYNTIWLTDATTNEDGYYLLRYTGIQKGGLVMTAKANGYNQKIISEAFPLQSDVYPRWTTGIQTINFQLEPESGGLR